MGNIDETSNQAPTPAPWQIVEGELRAKFSTENFATGLSFVNAVGQLAEDAQHHPDVFLTYPSVQLALFSHEEGSLTDKDFEMARKISEIAADQGVKYGQIG